MAFGSGAFGGGGFGSNNNQQSSGFGGFGANNTNSNTNTGGFGSSANTGTSIFGANNNNNNSNTGSGMFGGNSNSTPFGGGGFGANNAAPKAFGSTPFGSSTTGGGLFGGGGSTGGAFGGFGATNNTTTTTPAFGANNTTGGGLFGQPKTGGFGTTNTGGGGLFGGGGNTGGGFGSTNANPPAQTGFGGGGFGASNNNNQVQTNTGTANVQFSAVSEKDGTTATQQYQTITFQQPYQNYSLEELRVVDYNQGRRYGNQNGQAGAFGQNTGFGGFGSNSNTTTTTGFGANTNTNTGGSLFGGGAANTTGGFGQSTGSGFGSNTNTTGGGMFGANKPATGGLFGASTTTPAAGTTGGLFGGGSTNNTTGGFGTGGGFGASTTGTGGLFGSSQAKPTTGGLFGGPAATTTPFGGATNTNTFGQNATGGGLFGSNNTTAAAPAFGGNTATTTTGGGLFGNTGGGFGQATQTQPQPATGGLFGGGGFGAQPNQQKPGGLFGGTGATTTGGGLFGGSNSTTQQPGGLFGGSAANTNTGGSLFGQKPATTGNSLFGGNTANTGTTSGGLFGGMGTQDTQANTGGSLFGGLNNQSKPGGMFGGSTNTNTGGSLFGNSTQNNQQPLFGQNNQQQQPQNNANSLFGTSGSSLLNTSMNTNPYGNDQLFAGLATPTQNPGPLATPLSSSQKNKKSAVLPQYKLNPAASTRLLTPQNKRVSGYGFSYSTYGTPNSASSQASPGFSGSLFGAGSSLSRSLGKSLSTSNLRNSFSQEPSILSPGAFSTTGRGYGNGSLKKLNVNRNLNTRVPLFDDPPQKRVSFAQAEGSRRDEETALVVRPDDGERSPSAVENGRTPKEPVNGRELARVPEDPALTPKSSSSTNLPPGSDAKPGAYWSSPTIDALKKFSTQDLRNVRNFVVGRQGVGQIRFHMGESVDLSDVDLDRLFGDIIVLNPRNATVYGAGCTAMPKPPMGSALNQPSEITLGNSWPRNKAGKKDVKHLERLKRVAGTTFVKYNQANGEWTFNVPHFSSYGLDYDDYSDDEDEDDQSSELGPVPDTPAQMQLRSSQMSSTPQEDSPVSPSQSSPDDTFDFKKGFKSRASVPGGFGDEVAYDDDAEMDETRGGSFLGQRSVGSLDGHHNGDYLEEGESEQARDQDMADSESSPVQTTEHSAAKEFDPFKTSLKPKSILKASQLVRPGAGTPFKGHQAVFDDDWANQLQRTISPKKQDRHALRESQGNVLREHETTVKRVSHSAGGRNLTTAMDLMESLFGDTEKQKLPKRMGHGIELPYYKRPKTADDLSQLSQADQDFHSCSKPHFNETGVLIYGNKGQATLEGGIFATIQEPLVGATKDVRFTKMPSFVDSVPGTLALQKLRTAVLAVDGVPMAKLQTNPTPLNFAEMVGDVAIDTPAGFQEQRVWQLLALLFDNPDVIPEGVDAEHMDLFRKEQLSDFWRAIVWDDAQKHAQKASSVEEKAIAHLTCNNVAEACHCLLSGFDLRLATMVAQIGGDMSMRESLITQIEQWRRLDVLAEMEDSTRALYELLSGNCAKSEGKQDFSREIKASTFGISKRFKLDWRRAFGLRLWYGTTPTESIDMAVAQLATALKDGAEDVKPVPWFVETRTDMGWTDPHADDREDLLWGVLKLYASTKLELDANIEDVLAPENISGNPLNARLAFQLFQLFKSRQQDATESDLRKVAMPTVRSQSEDLHRRSLQSSVSSHYAKDEQAENPLVELGDKITLTYAASLHTPEHWTTGIWVYAHLSSPTMREHYIQLLLNQFCNTYALEEADPTYVYLTNDLKIPTTWLHAAAALYAKTQGDALQQASHLIKAKELDEAHEVLCRKVGPEAIISRDYDALRELIGGFLPESQNSTTLSVASRVEKSVPGWRQGGQIYFDYIELLDLTSQRATYRVDEDLNERIQELLVKLQRALEITARERLELCGLEERVALMEIAGTVAAQIAKSSRPDHSSILRLPLTEDARLKHSCAMSTSYYRNVMASASR